MKFLDRIGLARSIEIPTSSTAEEFEQQLLNFKNSAAEKFGFLYSSKIIPSDLKVNGHTFVITKDPRLFKIFTPTGEVKGHLVTRDQNVIAARVYSIYWHFYLMLLWTLLIGSFGVFIPTKSSVFLWIWLATLMLFDVLNYFSLRMSAKRLERQFRIFMKEEILSKAL